MMLPINIFAFVAIFMSFMATTVMATPILNESLPGKPLTDMGKRYNIPHLQLTGEVINHLAHDLRVEMAEICRLHPCSLWTTWSPCKYNEPGKYGRYGASNRSRNCGFNSSLCLRYGDQNMEHEHRICKCKDGFNVTKHGYCLKLFNIKLNHDTAKARCHKEGGYLASFGSEKKMEDLITIMTKNPSTAKFWVDGLRRHSFSKWIYENPPEDMSFGVWGPKSSSSMVCKAQYRSGGKWYFRVDLCNTCMYYMCEILA